MTMHLERGLTTTNTKKRKVKVTKAQQAEFERGWKERNQRLKEMHLPKETFEQYMEWLHGKGKKEKTETLSGKITKKALPEKTKNFKTETKTVEQRDSRSINSGLQHTNDIPSKNEWITGPCSSKPSPTYTGTKVLGIATLHKSNAVPIFSDEEAIDISRMRR